MKLIAQVLVYEEGACVKEAIEPWLSACTHIDVFEGAFQTLTGLGYALRSQDATIPRVRELALEHQNIALHHHRAVNEPVLRNNHLWRTIARYGDDAFLFILDADEIYTPNEVERCIDQIKQERDQFNTWWVNFKNYVGDEKTYHLGFRVPRFFKLDRARGFSGYNDVCFEDGVKATDIRDVLPKHLSWHNTTKILRKLEWQKSLGWEPSFVLINGKIQLNDEYYIKTNKLKPIFHHES